MRVAVWISRHYGHNDYRVMYVSWSVPINGGYFSWLQAESVLQKTSPEKGLVFQQAVFLPSPRPHPLAHFVNSLPGPDLAARIQDGDLITNSGFFDPPSNRLRAGYLLPTREGVTAEYPSTLYHYCFRWSVFF